MSKYIRERRVQYYYKNDKTVNDKKAYWSVTKILFHSIRKIVT